MSRGVIVFASHRRSRGTLALLAKLRTPADPIPVAAVLGVSEFTWRRFKEWSRRYRGQLLAKVRSTLRRSGSGSAFDEEAETFAERLRAEGVLGQTIPSFCKRQGIPWHVVPSLNADESIALVKRYAPACAIYSGGGILRKPLIEALPGGILNMHCGPLPHIRGMNGVEWSLYFGIRPTVTLHLIDAGIDTGAALAERTLAVARGETVARLRARTVLAGIDLVTDYLRQHGIGPWQRRPAPARHGPQFYTMAESLLAVVQGWLDDGTTPVVDPGEVKPGDLRPASQKAQRVVAS
jgi:hypothetical protein